jgi:hypothetical protein
MNERFQVTDTFTMGNGYSTDLHELLLLENGNYWCLGYDPQIIAMDTVVPGGQPDATVIGLIVQELDSLGNVVFQWRSWDHFQITDCHDWGNITDSIVDYVHGNSIALDSDTSILISCRNMDEITRIDRRSGEIIWRWNGKNDQFSWIDDNINFHVQHHIRLMDNGNLSLFDNGRNFSSAAEYKIDEENMTATLINRIRRFPDAHGVIMGNAQRLENGYTICGWGSDPVGVTEFDDENNMRLDIMIPDLNYRAFKFNWETSLFNINMDTLDFGVVTSDSLISKEFLLVNHANEELVFNRIIQHESPFSIDLEVPFALGPFNDTAVEVSFKVDTAGNYFDVITFCIETDTGQFKQRIGNQIFLKAAYNLGLEGPGDAPDFLVYPNPFTNRLTISSDDFMSTIRIFDSSGYEVFSFEDVGRKSIFLDEVNLEGMRSGVYIVRVETKKGNIGIKKILKF